MLPLGHVGGHGRIRVPRRARPLAGRPAGQGDPRADRAGGGRDPVRDPRRGARAALDRPAACATRPRVLGAPPRKVWREVDLPIAMRAFVVGFGFAVAVSLGEFGATLFVARPDTPTIPIAISRFLCPARRAQHRPGDGDVDGADGRDRARRARDRTRARAPARRVLMLTVEQAVVRFGAAHGGRRRRSRGRARARRSRSSGRAAAGRRRCCARSRACSRSTAGRISWDGEDLAAVPPHRRRFGLMFQEYALFPHRDVDRQRRVRAAHGRHRARRAQAPRRRGARPRGARRARRPAGRGAVGRRAATGRARARARGRAATAHARRAARRARPAVAGAAAARDRRAARPRAAARAVRDARARGGVRARRPGRDDARGPRRAGRARRPRCGGIRPTSGPPRSSASVPRSTPG